MTPVEVCRCLGWGSRQRLPRQHHLTQTVPSAWVVKTEYLLQCGVYVQFLWISKNKYTLWNHQCAQNIKLMEITIQKTRDSQQGRCVCMGACQKHVRPFSNDRFHLLTVTLMCSLPLDPLQRKLLLLSSVLTSPKRSDWESPKGLHCLIFKIMILLPNPWPFAQ